MELPPMGERARFVREDREEERVPVRVVEYEEPPRMLPPREEPLAREEEADAYNAPLPREVEPEEMDASDQEEDEEAPPPERVPSFRERADATAQAVAEAQEMGAQQMRKAKAAVATEANVLKAAEANATEAT